MITNIIKNIIKDIPSVANSTIYLFSENKDNGEFTVALPKTSYFSLNSPLYFLLS